MAERDVLDHEVPGLRLTVRELAVDGLVATAVVSALWLELATSVVLPGQSDPTLTAYLLSVLIGAPYCAHRRIPRLVTAVTYAAVLCYSLSHFTGYPGYAVFALVFGVALHVGRRWAVVTYLTGMLVMGVSLAAQLAAVATPAAWISTGLVLTVAVLAGENLRSRTERRERRQADAERAARDQSDRARSAAVEERLRIARDLHDVLAHSMSVIAVQAGTANHVIDQRPEQARKALATIETTSREALVEMRRLLTVLRTDADHASDLVPAQSLSNLDQLLEGFAGVGLNVVMTREGELDDLSPALDLTAYRIAQEALTNALRHGGPSADITLTRRNGTLGIRISNDGPAAADTPGEATTPTPGHGLIGMRERAAMFGGTVEVGRLPGGGFLVCADLPIETTSSSG